MDYKKPLFEKYRPNNIDDLILSPLNKTLISNLINNYENFPNLLLYGPPGTGKTSCVSNILKIIYKKNYSSMVLELNASDDRNIKVVRENIKDFAISNCNMLTNNKYFLTNDNYIKFKVVVLDEIDSMTQDAQFCLRRIMETHIENVRFIFICNYVNKVIPAIQSRCCRLKFFHLNHDEAIHRLKYICNIENINISDESLELLLKISNNDLRKVLNIVQNISYYDKNIDNELIYLNTGFPIKKYFNNVIDIFLNIPNKYLIDELDNNNLKNIINIYYLLEEIRLFIINLNIDPIKKCNILIDIGTIESNHYYLMDEKNTYMYLSLLLKKELL